MQVSKFSLFENMRLVVLGCEAQIWRIHHSHLIVTLAQGNNKTGIHFKPWTTIKSFMVAELSSELGS